MLRGNWKRRLFVVVSLAITVSACGMSDAIDDIQEDAISQFREGGATGNVVREPDPVVEPANAPDPDPPPEPTSEPVYLELSCSSPDPSLRPEDCWQEADDDLERQIEVFGFPDVPINENLFPVRGPGTTYTLVDARREFRDVYFFDPNTIAQMVDWVVFGWYSFEFPIEWASWMEEQVVIMYESYDWQCSPGPQRDKVKRLLAEGTIVIEGFYMGWSGGGEYITGWKCERFTSKGFRKTEQLMIMLIASGYARADARESYGQGIEGDGYLISLELIHFVEKVQ